MKRLFSALSIEAKLPIAIGALWLVVVAGLSWVTYQNVARSGRDAAETRLANASQQLAGLLQASAENMVSTARTAGDRAELRSYLRAPDDEGRAAAEEAMAVAGPRPQRVVAVELWNPRGERVLAVGQGKQAAAALASEGLLDVTASGDSGAVGTFLASGDSVLLPAIAPVRDASGLAGYVVQWHHIANSPKNREQTLELIGPESALFIGSPGSAGVWTDLGAIVPPPPVDVARMSGVVRYERPAVGTRLAVGTAVPGTPWSVVVEFSERHVLAPAQRFLEQVVLVGLAVFLVGLVGVWLLTRRITRRLRRLTLAAESISVPAGDGPSPAQPRSGDEVKRLSAAFNLMAERVDDTHQRLEDKVIELRSAQAQFAHAQRMEAVGRLAGGVAHDFNNLLTVILGEVELALGAPAAASEESLLEIRKAGERAAVLTRQLLAFSRRQMIAPALIDLDELIVELEKMLGRLIGENIRLVTRPSNSEAMVCADRGQIEQVVVNLVVNARDAMPDGGTLVVETQRVTLSEDYASTRLDTAAGDYVMLAVSDTGTGMSEDVKAHLFEPFFTTKEQGRGTGLGLATCYGIVKQAGGHIAAYTELGVGTTMRIYLPLVEGKAALHSAPDDGVVRGDETILLVEDEPGVRQVATRILDAQGYQVLPASNGEEALQLLGEYPDTIHLMITDVVLPDLGGRQLAERAATVRNEMKILFASGYTDDVILQHQLVAQDVAFLQKPFTAAALGRKVRDLLDA